MKADGMLFREMLDKGQAKLKEEVEALGVDSEDQEVLIRQNRDRVSDGISAIFYDVGAYSPDFDERLAELINEEQLREQYADLVFKQAQADRSPVVSDGFLVVGHNRPLQDVGAGATRGSRGGPRDPGALPD